MSFKEMRQKMGYTLTQISKIYDIPYSTLQKWEYGVNEPPKYVIQMMWELYQLQSDAMNRLIIGG